MNSYKIYVDEEKPTDSLISIESSRGEKYTALIESTEWNCLSDLLTIYESKSIEISEKDFGFWFANLVFISLVDEQLY